VQHRVSREPIIANYRHEATAPRTRATATRRQYCPDPTLTMPCCRSNLLFSERHSMKRRMSSCRISRKAATAEPLQTSQF